jgi:hypothetical protein
VCCTVFAHVFGFFGALKKGTFFACTQKKSAEVRGSASSDCRNASRFLVFLAHPSLSPDRDFFGPHPKKVPLNKTFRGWSKKCIFLSVIRTEVGILGLGRNSGASGDFQLTRSAPSLQDAVLTTLSSIRRSRRFFPERMLTLVGADRFSRRDGRQTTRSPEANGSGVSASRFAGAGCFTKRPRPEVRNRPAH